MVELKAAQEPKPDPKIGKTKTKSGVAFPYYNLSKSEEVAKIIRDKNGGACDRSQLAGLLKYSGIKNGGFLTRVAAAKMFGFIDQEGDQLRITNRGVAAVSPVSDGDAERARYEAFLSVELFRKVFDKFNGQTLPSEAGLTNLLLNEYKVVPDRVPPTLKIMLDSAEAAGFFKTSGNRTRMIAPFLTNAAQQNPPNKDDPPPPSNNAGLPANNPPANVGGTGGNGGGRVHPAIMGLLNDLPPAGTAITEKKRASLIGAFSAVVGFIYPDKDDA